MCNFHHSYIGTSGAVHGLLFILYVWLQSLICIFVGHFQAFRHAKAWMFKKEEQLSIEMKAKQLALPSPEEQAQIACQTKMTKGTPEGWTYKNVNQVFYFPEGVELR